ncbi:DNA fragmentation factor subunit alpha-like [Hetaerina americana]|uniref:DNA fragmentation factor subunit alpha-like n=1 Tax=Hetaerina americana TaxID=62018 RepID=UPI003A7F4BDF
MEEESSNHDNTEAECLPYKVVDYRREKKKGVVASSLQELIFRGQEKLGLDNGEEVTVVLEQDGTEVDDEDYFATLERNTSLMLLSGQQRWLPPGKLPRLTSDQLDGIGDGTGCDIGEGELLELVERLHRDIGLISLLGSRELELLSEMEPEEVVLLGLGLGSGISTGGVQCPDIAFLEHLKEASGRFLAEKRQASEAMHLLRLYHRASVAGSQVIMDELDGGGDGDGGGGDSGDTLSSRCHRPASIQPASKKERVN